MLKLKVQNQELLLASKRLRVIADSQNYDENGELYFVLKGENE